MPFAAQAGAGALLSKSDMLCDRASAQIRTVASVHGFEQRPGRRIVLLPLLLTTDRSLAGPEQLP